MRKPSFDFSNIISSAVSVCLVFTVLLSASPAVAATASQKRVSTQGESVANAPDEDELGPVRRGVTFGFLTGQFSYSEKGMKDSGMLNGLAMAIDVRRPGSMLAARLEGEVLAGMLNYEGALINIKTMASTPHTTPTLDYVYGARALVGLAVDLSPSTELRPFFGGGYRYLNDNMEGIGSYEREVTYLYLPLGVALSTSINDRWKVRASAEYDRLVSGVVKSHLTQLGRASDPENRQGQGDGFRASLDISGTMSERYDLHIMPYYQEWHVQDSDLQFVDNTFGYAQEPENRTELFGVNISLGI